jgi:plastocyanin
MSDTMTQDPGTRPRPTGTQLIVLGVALLVVGNLWVLPFDPSAIFFSAPGIVLACLAAFLAWRFGTWAKVVSLVIGVLLLLASAAFGGVFLVASVFDFATALAGALCGLLMVVGSVIAIRSRDGRSTFLDGCDRAVFGGTAAIWAVLAAVSGVLSVTSDATVAEADRVGAIEITVHAFSFPEEPIAIPAGQTTKLLLRNDDRYFHTITSDELGFDEALNPGDEVLVEVTPQDTGTFQLWCRPHAAQSDGVWNGMVGTIVIN